MEEEQGIPQLTVVIGANGAGKTTWVRRSRGLLPKPFYNADSIAEQRGPTQDVKGIVPKWASALLERGAGAPPGRTRE